MAFWYTQDRSTEGSDESIRVSDLLNAHGGGIIDAVLGGIIVAFILKFPSIRTQVASWILDYLASRSRRATLSRISQLESELSRVESISVHLEVLLASLIITSLFIVGLWFITAFSWGGQSIFDIFASANLPL